MYIVKSQSTTFPLVDRWMRLSVSFKPFSSLYDIFRYGDRRHTYTHLVPQDLHGEVCPANWTKGGKTMKADPKGSLEYFSTVDTNGHATNGHATKRAGDDMAVDDAKKVKV